MLLLITGTIRLIQPQICRQIQRRNHRTLLRLRQMILSIHDLVHAANMTPDELAELLSGRKSMPVSSVADNNQSDCEEAYNESEE